MKMALAFASLLLVAGGTAACGDDGGDGGDGGGGDTTEAASKEDFCGAFQDFYDDLVGMTGQEENLGEVLKNAAQRIRDVGTPEDMPDDAKEGLELTLDAIDELPDDATPEQMQALEENFSEEEKEKSEAFSDYLEKTCPDIGETSDNSTDDSTDDSGGS